MSIIASEITCRWIVFYLPIQVKKEETSYVFVNGSFCGEYNVNQWIILAKDQYFRKHSYPMSWLGMDIYIYVYIYIYIYIYIHINDFSIDLGPNVVIAQGKRSMNQVESRSVVIVLFNKLQATLPGHIEFKSVTCLDHGCTLNIDLSLQFILSGRMFIIKIAPNRVRYGTCIPQQS